MKYLIFILVLLFACSSPTSSEPEVVIDSEFVKLGCMWNAGAAFASGGYTVNFQYWLNKLTDGEPGQIIIICYVIDEEGQIVEELIHEVPAKYFENNNYLSDKIYGKKVYSKDELDFIYPRYFIYQQ